MFLAGVVAFAFVVAFVVGLAVDFTAFDDLVAFEVTGALVDLAALEAFVVTLPAAARDLAVAAALLLWTFWLAFCVTLPFTAFVDCTAFPAFVVLWSDLALLA